MTLRREVIIALTLSLWLSSRQEARAEPSFARTYHADCTLCHTVYPRLNRTGYEFRRHGYRFITAPASFSVPASPESSHAATNQALVASGQALVAEQNCRSCHAIEGKGGRIGPSLDAVGTRRTPEYISSQIINPKGHNPSSVMPPVHATPDQIKAIVEYLGSLRAPSAAVEHAHEPKIFDYLGAMWTPAIRLSQSNGTVDASYDTRELTLFAAGTLGSNFSMFIESTPTTEQTSFADFWGEAQGVFNTSGPANFAQIRAGQLLALQGAGFGATDRVFSDSSPLIYNPINGFAAARFVRGASGEYTFAERTTLKVFGGESSDHSRSNGVILEQLIGSTGLSGFSVSFSDGSNPLQQDNVNSQEFRFRRLLLAGNKTFQDARNRERFNLIGAVMLGDDNHLIGASSNSANHSYGSYVELDAVPIPRHIGAYIRIDQLRPSTQQPGSIHAGTAGVTLDFTHYARLLLEYQRFDSSTGSNFFSIGFRFNL